MIGAATAARGRPRSVPRHRFGATSGRRFRDDSDREGTWPAGCVSGEFRFRLLAYCLMTNHVHLAVGNGRGTAVADHGAPAFDLRQWFNRRHERVGHLFQGRYKAFLVETTGTSTRSCATSTETRCPPASCRTQPSTRGRATGSSGAARGPEWLDVDPLLALLDGSRRAATRRYAELVDGTAPASIPDPREAVERAAATARIARPDPVTANDPIILRIQLDDLLEIVARECGLTLGVLAGRERGGEVADARCRAAHLARHLFRIPLRRVALRLHRDDSSFARPLARLESRLERDDALRARMQRLTDTLLDAANPEIRNQD